MPPMVKKTYSKKLKEKTSHSSNTEVKTECEKENKNLEEKCELGTETEHKDFDSLFKSPLKEKLNLKPLSFWSKKLKDLEPESSFTKPKKRELYEFSGTETEESDCLHKKKKKVKQKRAPRKIKQPVVTNAIQKPTGMRLLRKIKKVHSQSLFKEQFILKKEREKLADRGKKFTFSPGMPCLGITSTPAINKDNLVGASNFLFMSPITNEGIANDKAPQCVTPKEPEIREAPFVFETPKLPERRISYRRVLRNGKVL